MRVTMFSNFLNHHQLAFCTIMYEKLGDNFTFVATEKVPQEQLDLGYQDMSRMYSFCINTYDNGIDYNKAMMLGDECDVVILGSAPEEFLKKRLVSNKLTFRYSERIFKKGRWRIFSPRALINYYKYYSKYRSNNYYLLCAGGYTPGDFTLINAFPKKMFKWGYFPEAVKYSIDDLVACKEKEPISLLWVGRFLNWKHPEKAIAAAKYLRNRGFEFVLNMLKQK